MRRSDAIVSILTVPNNSIITDLYNSDPLGEAYQRKLSRARTVMTAGDAGVQSIVRNLQAQPALPYQLDLSVKYHLDKAAAMSGGADAKRTLSHLI